MGNCGTNKKQDEKKIKDLNSNINPHNSNQLKDSQNDSFFEQKKNISNKITPNLAYGGHPPIPLKIAIEASKSVCKVKAKDKLNYVISTGFFMKISDSKQYLITSNLTSTKVPSVNEIDIVIEIYNQKRMKLKLNERHVKNFIDITIIEIKKEDKIYNDIRFLHYDLGYIKGYDIYKKGFVFTIEYTYNDSASCASGQIIDIHKDEFSHSIPTDFGAAGCPIILLNNNINVMRVIGIHSTKDKFTKKNYAT